jgi:ATP-dependent Clp protease ATP-binding subunit ClpA
MIEPSDNLNKIFNNAVILATENQHEYITIEHLICAILNNNESFKFVKDFGADAGFIKTNVNHYVKSNLNDIKVDSNDIKPKKTN